MSNPYGVVLPATSSDAFSRFRVSSPQNLFSASFEYDTNPLLFVTSITGSGSVAKTSGETSLTLSVGTASGAQAINQTKTYFRYEPSKSQLIFMTAVIGVQVANVTKRIGYFDANNGVFFEMSGSQGIRVVQRTNTSGSPVDTAINQADWNMDKLNGAGPSGVNLDFSKSQIFVIDFQWLGVGRVRFGFNYHGQFVICHEIYNDNVITSPYMNTGNLPLRAEITNTAASAGAVLKQICFSVSAEGSLDLPAAYNFSASNGASTISVTTRRPIISIRPAATFDGLTNRAKIDFSSLELAAIGNPAFWELVYDGTLSGSPSFSSVNASSVVEYDTAATGISNGLVIGSGFVPAGSGQSRPASSLESLPLKLPFALDIAGANPDVLSLVVTGVGGASSVAGSLNWSEVR